MREARRSPIAPGVVAVITFLAPWVLGFAGVTAIAWTAWIIAILTVLVEGTLLVSQSTQMKTA